jgi:DUF917 family protein
MRKIGIEDLEAITLGATLLGTGGGGDPYIANLMVRQAIEDFGPVSVIEASELSADARVITVSAYGAPTVLIEKVPAGTEFVAAVHALSAYLGEVPAAVMAAEAGGMNTLIPLLVSATTGLPVVDADGMRRAFPQVEMTVFTLAGISASPMSLADEQGNVVTFETVSNRVGEKLVRGASVLMGLTNAFCAYPMTAGQVQQSAILGSISYCEQVGRLLLAVQRRDSNAWEEFFSFTGGRKIFAGKLIDIDRRTTEGFARGTAVVEHFDDPTRTLRIEIQNEMLLALEDGEVIVTPPDLICVIDHETADPITTEGLTYGQRINVLALPCAREWHRPGMLEVVGPRAFGYDVDYVAFEGKRS